MGASTQSIHITYLLQPCSSFPPTPWQAFKMALAVPSSNTPPHTRGSPPPPLTKESSSAGRALAPSCWHLVGSTLRFILSNGLACARCMLDFIFETNTSMISVPIVHCGCVHHPGTPLYPSCSVYMLCLFGHCQKYDDDVSAISPNPVRA